MRGTLVLAGPDLTAMSKLAAELGASFGTPLLIVASDPVEKLTAHPVNDASAAVVWLTGRENVAELRLLLAAYPGTPFVLLTRTYPPHAAVAHVVSSYHAAELPDGESPIVVAATLIGLLPTRPSATL
jgi:hypothetical protein